MFVLEEGKVPMLLRSDIQYLRVFICFCRENDYSLFFDGRREYQYLRAEIFLSLFSSYEMKSTPTLERKDPLCSRRRRLPPLFSRR